jgi:hypothetical protein
MVARLRQAQIRRSGPPTEVARAIEDRRSQPQSRSQAQIRRSGLLTEVARAIEDRRSQPQRDSPSTGQASFALATGVWCEATTPPADSIVTAKPWTGPLARKPTAEGSGPSTPADTTVGVFAAPVNAHSW